MDATDLFQTPEIARLAGSKSPPTLAEVEDVMRLAKLTYKGHWQRRIMRHLCENRYAILQAPRQNVGKTWCVAVYIAACLFKGLSVVVGMPTLNQGERILIDRIDGIMRQVENAFGALRRRTDNVRYKRWDNDAVLGIISMAEGSKAGAQGFTAHVLVVDEAHEAMPDMFAVVEPTINVARETGADRIIFVGVGGNSEEHLIEARKRDEEGNPSDVFSALVLLPGDLIDEKPELEKMYADIEKTTPRHIYNQHYLMQPQVEGSGKIFPVLEGNFPTVQGDFWYEFGIDVGRVNNLTVVHAIRCWEDQWSLVDTLRLYGEDFPRQAVKIADWINRYPFLPENVRLERNTIGWGLYDPLRNIYPFYNITPVETTENAPDFNKSSWILWLQHQAVQGKLAVEDMALRLLLKRLMYQKKMSASYELRYEWPESKIRGVDELAGLWVWASKRAHGMAFGF